MKEKFLKAYFGLILIFIPFQAIFTEALDNRTHLSGNIIFWLAHWYEIFLPLVFIFLLYDFISKKIKLNLVQITGAIVILYGIVILIFVGTSFHVGLEGFRFSLLALVLFLFASSIHMTDKDNTYNLLARIYIYLSVFIASLAVIERFLPLFYWARLGVTSLESSFGYGSRVAGNLIQSSSIMGGPNQMGSYLIPAFFILLANPFKINPKLKYPFLALITVAIFLSFSRSALIGLVIGFLIYAALYFKTFIKVIAFSVFGFLGATIYYLFAYSSTMEDFLLHGTSQKFHFEALLNFKSQFLSSNIMTRLVGRGLGTSGPLVIKYGVGSIPESWYLQLILEIGLIGLLLWLIFIACAVSSLIKAKNSGLAFGLISVSVVALFLHTWADNPAIAYTLMILLGLYIGGKQYEKNIN